ncbi:septum formation family protein [Demequina sp. SO4-18]|uniref:septum formation family protein n=1 Tax=Demequina sp. SO4-18 TaxID=3401026 RepID=UPI003B598667
MSDFTPPPGPSDAPEHQVRQGAARASSTAAPATAEEREATRPRSMLRSGKGIAIAAWVAIGAGVALLVGISWSAALAWSDRGLAEAEIGETGDLHAMQIVPGMCLDEVGDDGSVVDATVVACDEPHRGEVFTSARFELFAYPGDDQMTADALDMCGTRLDGLLPEGASWVAWAPSEASWERGDRVALCIAVFDEPREEPLSPAGIDAVEDDEPVRDGQEA